MQILHRAAASEELSGQASLLLREVSRFRLREAEGTAGSERLGAVFWVTP